MQPQLAKPGEPLVLANGMKIDPSTGEVIKELPPVEEIPTNIETQRELARIRRTVHDLPALPKQMNTVSVVLCYEMFGLAPRDIALATGLPADQIRGIQQTDIYTTYKQDILNRFFETEAEDVRSIIAQHARDAAHKVVNTINSDNAGLALKASQDILDRSGHRPVDRIEHMHRMAGGLRITVIDGNQSSIPDTSEIIEGEVIRGDASN